MSKVLDIPWKKYGTIAELAKRLQDTPSQLGRTVLQKMVYILQEVFDVPCGYQYSLYTYGPYSSDLANDLNYVDFLKGVVVEWRPEIGGYHIHPGENNDNICKKAEDFLTGQAAKFNTAVHEFGDKQAKELELIATIIYVDRYANARGESLSLGDLVNETKEIKPKFTRKYIKETAEDLIGKGYLAA